MVANIKYFYRWTILCTTEQRYTQQKHIEILNNFADTNSYKLKQRKENSIENLHHWMC